MKRLRKIEDEEAFIETHMRNKGAQTYLASPLLWAFTHPHEYDFAADL